MTGPERTLRDALIEARAEIKQLRAYRLVMAVFGVPEDAPLPFALLGDDNKPFALGVQWPGGAVTVKSTPPDRLGNITSASLDDYFTQYGTSPVVWLSEDLGTLAEHEERAMAAEQALARARADTAEAIAQAIDAEMGKGSWPGGGSLRMGFKLAARIARQYAATEGPCCDLHNRNCEPPSELCCRECTERSHPNHPPGEQCVMSATEGPRP